MLGSSNVDPIDDLEPYNQEFKALFQNSIYDFKV